MCIKRVLRNMACGKVVVCQFSLVRAFGKSLGLALLIIPIIATLSWPEIVVSSDYLTSFYVAGKMVGSGQASHLYPGPTDTSLIATEFNRVAHQLLPALPKATTSIYMYSPLIAAIFVPFSMLPPLFSMAAWQVVSIIALVVSMLFAARASGQEFRSVFWQSLFCMPVIQTIMIGHIGIVIGLFPLCLGYFFLTKCRPVLAGFIWSLLLLKLQFLPTVLLMVGALTLSKKPKCLIGFSAGLFLLSILTIISLSWEVSAAWLASLKLSDTIFSDPRYGYPTYLISSLPAVILHWFPFDLRNAVKIPAYLTAFIIGLHALWFSWRLLKRGDDGNLALVFLMGICVLPLVLPHFLFYDLSVYAVFGVLCGSGCWSNDEGSALIFCRRVSMIGFALYFISFASTHTWLAQSSVLMGIMCFIYWRIMSIAQKRLAIG